MLLKASTFLIFLLLLAGFLPAQKTATLPELMHPHSITVDRIHLYVAERARVIIYSLENLRHLVSIGREGQGPREFQTLPHVPISVDVSGTYLLVASMGKISYYDKNGGFIKEVKARSLALNLRRCGDNFLGWSQSREDGVIYNTINIFDRELNKAREVYRVKDSYQGPGRGYRVLHQTFSYWATDNRILLPGEDDASINIFDQQMKKRHTIRIKKRGRRVSADFKRRLTHYLRTSQESKNVFDRLQPLRFPDRFPAIADFFIDPPTVYVLTWERDGKGSECFSFDMTGRYLKHQILPIRYETDLQPYPAVISAGTLYQLVENPANESWELFRTRLE